jgi:hypothetical protein
MLPRGYKIVLDWFQEVVAAGKGYENPEESKEVDVIVEGIKVEESKTEQVNVDEAKLDEAKAVEAKAEEPTVGESKLDEVKAKELSTKDSYVVQEFKEAEGRGCMDLGEEVWKEEMKKIGLKVEDCENRESTDEKFKIELGKKEKSKHEDAKLDKSRITDSKVEELNMDNLKTEKLGEDVVKKEGAKEDAIKEKEEENFLPDDPIMEIPMARGLVLRSDPPGTDVEQ